MMVVATNLRLGGRVLVEGGNVPTAPPVVSTQIDSSPVLWPWTVPTPTVTHSATIAATGIAWPWAVPTPAVDVGAVTSEGIYSDTLSTSFPN